MKRGEPTSELNSKYKFFDHMSTEELEEMLRQDSELPQGKDNEMGAIIYISDVLSGREMQNPTGKFTDVQPAWNSFKKDYYPIPYYGNPILDEKTS